LSDYEAEILQAPVGSAALYVDRLTYTINSTGECPAVWYLAVYKGDEYTFRVEHVKEPLSQGIYPIDQKFQKGGVAKTYPQN